MDDCDDAGVRARHAVERAAREDHGRVLALLIRDLRDFQLAEDCLQDALESALVHWRRNGPPQSAAAWLLQTARHKAIDRIRRAGNLDRKAAAYALLLDLSEQDAEEEPPIDDERLRLIFTCCHPAIDPKTRVALTLRTVCGLTTGEIARAFLDSDDAMAQRLVRARHKIDKAGIPYVVPGADAWPERLGSVLSVVYLIFNEGYAVTAGQQPVRVDLCDEAIRLARLLTTLVPDNPEIEGLLALTLLNNSRAGARFSATRGMIALDEQDRSLWNRTDIHEGISLLETALRRQRPGPYQLQAAISAIHAEAPSHAATRWRDIVAIYERLHDLSANAVYRLNRSVALSYVEGPQTALDALDSLAGALEGYQPFYAARADFLQRLGRTEEAGTDYAKAIALSQSHSERQFLEARSHSSRP